MARSSKVKKPKKSKYKLNGELRAIPVYNENSAIRSALRRSFSRSPIARGVKNAGRREVPKYKKDGTLALKPSVQYHCQCCQQWVPSGDIKIDHIIPVVDVKIGFVDWNTYIPRLWCAVSNLQRLCSACHDVKTAQEDVERTYWKALNKQVQE